jgi:hypothetical protein
MMDVNKMGEPVGEQKPASKSTIALIAAVTLLGGMQGYDIATADAQKEKVIAAYVEEKTMETVEKEKTDSVVTAKDGRKCIEPAECIFRPNIIIDSTRVFEMTVRETVSGKIWFKGVVRCNDSTARLDAGIRLQPCSATILNADSIPDIKE